MQSINILAVSNTVKSPLRDPLQLLSDIAKSQNRSVVMVWKGFIPTGSWDYNLRKSFNI